MLNFKRLTLLSLLAFTTISISACGKTEENTTSNTTENPPDIQYTNTTYKNSIQFDIGKGEKGFGPCADPFCLKADDGYYYLYSTNETVFRGDDSGYRFDYGPIWRSIDLVNWTYVGSVFDGQEDVLKWGQQYAGVVPGVWAPNVVKIADQYNYYYTLSAGSSYNPGIGVATAPTPYGPWTHYGKVFDSEKIGVYNSSDQDVFVDDDGSIYMYYSIYDTGIMQYIIGVEMLDPVTADWDTYKILIRPGELTPKTTNSNMLIWEAYSGFKVAEGPYMLKSPNGLYYLTYSVNHYDDRYYTVCYAYSDEPLGDYTKPYDKDGNWTNLLFGYAGGMAHTTVFDQWDGFMSGTGHHCFFKSGDQWMIGYHAHKDRHGKVDANDGFAGRMFAMDYLYFDENGVPYTEGPTYSVQPLPSKISGYSNIALGATVKSTNVDNPERINDNFIVEHYNLPQEQNKEVTLKPGRSYIEIDFGKDFHIGGISIYNSAFYDYYLSEIEFINFFNGNAILDASFPTSYVNNEYEFVFPTSAFVFDFQDIIASRVVIGFNTNTEARLNEIKVFGY